MKMKTCLGFGCGLAKLRSFQLQCIWRTSSSGMQDCTNVALLLALSPVMLAFWIASSRVRENDHHPADICFGSSTLP